MDINVSLSEKLRLDGNAIFKSCGDDLENIIFKERLMKAINFYEKSKSITYIQADKLKCFKNITLSYLKLLNRWKTIIENEKSLEECFFFCSQAINNYSYWHICIDQSQVTEVDKMGKEIINDIFDALSPIADFEEKAKRLQKIYTGIFEKNFYLKALFSYNLSRLYFNKGIQLFLVDNFTRANSLFNTGKELIMNCLTKNLISYLDNSMQEDVQDLYDSIVFYIFSCENKNLIFQGEKLFKSAIFDDIELNMDYCFLALDKFRQAIMMASSLKYEKLNYADIECEAKCSAMIGQIYYSVFKNPVKAEPLLYQAVFLGLSVYPKVVTNQDWYLKAEEMLFEIRKKKEEEEEKLKKIDIDKVKSENPDIFKTLNEKALNSNQSFMEFIVEKHPPIENFEFKVDEMIKEKGIRKALIKLIPFYHPDKISSTHSHLNIVIFGEIAKILGNIYNSYK